MTCPFSLKISFQKYAPKIPVSIHYFPRSRSKSHGVQPSDSSQLGYASRCTPRKVNLVLITVPTVRHLHCNRIRRPVFVLRALAVVGLCQQHQKCTYALQYTPWRRRRAEAQLESSKAFFNRLQSSLALLCALNLGQGLGWPGQLA